MAAMIAGATHAPLTAMTLIFEVTRDYMQLKDVIEVMQHHRHGGYPVVDEQGRLCGMITLGDIREVPLAHRLETPVASVMSTKLAVVTPEQTLADAAVLMARFDVGQWSMPGTAPAWWASSPAAPCCTPIRRRRCRRRVRRPPGRRRRKPRPSEDVAGLSGGRGRRPPSRRW